MSCADGVWLWFVVMFLCYIAAWVGCAAWCKGTFAYEWLLHSGRWARASLVVEAGLGPSFPSLMAMGSAKKGSAKFPWKRPAAGWLNDFWSRALNSGLVYTRSERHSGNSTCPSGTCLLQSVSMFHQRGKCGLRLHQRIPHPRHVGRRHGQNRGHKAHAIRNQNSIRRPHNAVKAATGVPRLNQKTLDSRLNDQPAAARLWWKIGACHSQLCLKETSAKKICKQVAPTQQNHATAPWTSSIQPLRRQTFSSTSFKTQCSDIHECTKSWPFLAKPDRHRVQVKFASWALDPLEMDGIFLNRVPQTVPQIENLWNWYLPRIFCLSRRYFMSLAFLIAWAVWSPSLSLRICKSASNFAITELQSASLSCGANSSSFLSSASREEFSMSAAKDRKAAMACKSPRGTCCLMAWERSGSMKLFMNWARKLSSATLNSAGGLMRWSTLKKWAPQPWCLLRPSLKLQALRKAGGVASKSVCSLETNSNTSGDGLLDKKRSGSQNISKSNSTTRKPSSCSKKSSGLFGTRS